MASPEISGEDVGGSNDANNGEKTPVRKQCCVLKHRKKRLFGLPLDIQTLHAGQPSEHVQKLLRYLRGNSNALGLPGRFPSYHDHIIITSHYIMMTATTHQQNIYIYIYKHIENPVQISFSLESHQQPEVQIKLVQQQVHPRVQLLQKKT